MLLQPKAGDLTKEKIEITHFVDIFFNKLLSGTPSESSHINRWKLSFYQDLLHAVNSGQVKSVNVFMYSTIIKTLTILNFSGLPTYLVMVLAIQ